MRIEKETNTGERPMYWAAPRDDEFRPADSINTCNLVREDLARIGFFWVSGGGGPASGGSGGLKENQQVLCQQSLRHPTKASLRKKSFEPGLVWSRLRSGQSPFAEPRQPIRGFQGEAG